jgi:Zn-dependent protease
VRGVVSGAVVGRCSVGLSTVLGRGRTGAAGRHLGLDPRTQFCVLGHALNGSRSSRAKGRSIAHVTNAPPARSFRSGVVLGHIRDVPIVVAPSWLLVAVLLSAVYTPVIDDAVPNMSGSTAYLAGLGFAVLFGLCVLAHELGHTAVSIALGHPVRRVVLFALGGVSEMAGEPDRARDEFLIAASGPLVSLIIAGGAWLGYDASPSGALLTALLGLLCWSNLLLAVFNLLPGLPLDGGRLLRAAVVGCGARPATGTRVAAWTGRVVAIGVAVAGLWADTSSGVVAAAVFTLALAAYLWVAATQALRYAAVLDELPGVSVRDLLRPGMYVPDDVSVAEALRRAWEAQARGLVVLDATARPSAIVDEALIGAVPPDRRPWTPVLAVARPIEPGLVVPESIDAADLLRHMQAMPSREYLVVRPDGSAAGIIATRDFAHRLTARAVP